MELDVHGARELRLGTRGDDLCVKTFLQPGQRGENALDVYQHHVDRAGHDGQFLLEEIAGDRYAVTHEYLVGRAANAGQVDPLGPFGFCFGEEFGILGGGHHHVGEGRLVSVYEDVHFVGLEYAEVDAGPQRLRLAEQHVGDVGGDHRAAPAVGQGGPHRRHEDVFGIVVAAHVRSVQAGDYLAIDPARDGLFRGPIPLLLLGRSTGVGQHSFLPAELGQQEAAHVAGHVVIGPALVRDAILLGQLAKLAWPLDPIDVGSPLRGQQQCMDQLSGVIGMGSRAATNVPQEVSRHNRLDRGAANALLGAASAGHHPTRSHEAIAATDPQLPELALGLLARQAVPGRGNPGLPRHFDHGQRRGVTRTHVRLAHGISFIGSLRLPRGDVPPRQTLAHSVRQGLLPGPPAPIVDSRAIRRRSSAHPMPVRVPRGREDREFC